MLQRLCQALLVVCAIAVGGSRLDAAPQITNISIRGLQIGGTTVIAIQGRDLLPDPQLIAGVPIAKQVVLEGANDGNIQIELTLDGDVTPGICNLRLANTKGISELLLVAVDKMPQVVFAESVETKPIAMHGSLSSSNIARTSFTGKKDELLLIEVESQRLGGKLRPVLNLYDAQRKQIAMALPAPWLRGDARLAVTLPADGQYTIELHDLQYAAPSPGFYRLKIGSFQFADIAFPPAVQIGTNAKLALIGNLPAENQIDFAAGSVNRPSPAPWPDLEMPSGLRPQVLASPFPELVETPRGETPQLMPGFPVAVSGRLLQPGEEDVYRVPVTAGAKLRFDVQAEQFGSPIDALLEIRNEQGGRLGLNDDSTDTTDSRIEYTVPKDVAAIDVAIKDQNETADPHSVYRLVVTSLDAVPAPDFRLTISADTFNVPQGASQVFQVVAQRTGYDGPIKLELENLPSSVMASTSVIPAGCNGALVTLQGAGQQAENIITSLRGSSVGMTPEITATASFDKHPLGNLQPWLQMDLALALSVANEVPFEIDWAKPSSETQLVLGSTFNAPIKLMRPPGAIGPVRVSLFIGEPPPLVNGNPDVNQSVRAELATVDIPVDGPAKAAADALAVAGKAQADEMVKAKTTQELGAKATADAQAVVKVATDKLEPITKAVAEVQTQLTAAQAIREVAAKEKEAADAELVAASDETAKADAEAKAKVAAEKLAVAEKSVADIEVNLKTANEMLVAVQKEVTDSQAKLTAATEAATAANNAATAAVAVADTKQKEAETAFRAAEAKISNETMFNVIIPPNLPAGSCDVAFKTELRSVDNTRIVAEYYTPVRRLSILNPLGLALSTPDRFETRLDAGQGASVKLIGTIQRKAGFAGDVTVSIVGQPGGVTAPSVVLSADKSDFELELKFPANFQPAEVTSMKLYATGPYDPKAANIVVRTEIPITINVLAADAAQATQP
ncbi:MAG: hypothetical protein O3C40_04060 [Planctomycetota bacterium]|nr:hypothetical protein [Planctomycetota bacterium]